VCGRLIDSFAFAASVLLLQSTSTIHPSRPEHGTEIPIEEVRDKPNRQPASGGSDGPTKTSRDSPGSGRVGKRRVPMVDPVTEEMTEEEVDDNEAAVDKMKETVKETAAKVSRRAIVEALQVHTGIREVRLVFFSEDDAAIARTLENP